MKIFVKTLKGTHFEIEVEPQDTVADVKESIETSQGSDVYPATQQMLIHQGKVLKDGTTLEENKVLENSFVVIMLTKSKSSSTEGSSASTATTTKTPQPSAPSASPTATTTAPQAPVSTPAPPASVTTPVPVSSATTDLDSDPYGQAASHLVAGNNLERTIQQILDMGGGTWDRDTVVRALRAAFNNPARAIDYLYSGIPEQPEAPPAAPIPHPTPSTGPNANPLDLFPQGPSKPGGRGRSRCWCGAGNLDFLRDSPQFQALRAMVQANPQILQPMLQELGKQNPQLVRLIQQHQADFLRLINEPVEGGEGDVLGQLDAAMPQAITVTPEEREAIERLEAMGFDRATCIGGVRCLQQEMKNWLPNYLLDHMHEFED
ncbi:hypothetical protein M0R45_000911 [Rubus argutus]|uniref:Ubiquitin receptor RAD23 n=1 Tax=Rubus argutus TaxID=59490 RepID=A0AAW1VJ81_RUBAR